MYTGLVKQGVIKLERNKEQGHQLNQYEYLYVYYTI